jgi:hypothetical protein
MPRNRSSGPGTMVPLTRAPSCAASTWGPYYEALRPPRGAHFIDNWKVVPKWMDHAVRLWQRHQELRRAYEAAHGSNPAMWPTQHPGIVLGANAACLGCNWFHAGWSSRDAGVYEQHFKLAHRHEISNGAFPIPDGDTGKPESGYLVPLPPKPRTPGCG